MATALVIADGYRGLIYDVIECVTLLPSPHVIYDWCSPSRQQCKNCGERGPDEYCHKRFVHRTVVQQSSSYVTTHYGDIYVDEILEVSNDGKGCQDNPISLLL